jgi:ribosomal protein S21
MVQAKRKQNETTGSFLRRFSRQVQQSGILINARRNRFYQADPNKRSKRQSALYREEKRKKYDKLRKLGKIKLGKFNKGRK